MARPRYRPGSSLRIEVKRNRDRKPIATYLASRLCINDRRTLYLLSKGEVKVNGVRVEAGDILDFGEHSTIDVTFPLAWPPYLEPTEMSLEVLHEEESFVVLNKAPGIVVHPARGQIGCQRRLAHAHRQRRCVAQRAPCDQVLDDAPAKTAVGAGDEDHGGLLWRVDELGATVGFQLRQK